MRTFRRTEPREGGQSVLDTDALATDLPGQALLTYHADCYPLLFTDPAKGAVAIAHGGSAAVRNRPEGGADVWIALPSGQVGARSR